MNDFKSKLPDLKEITGIAGKLYTDIKTSVHEIIKEYQDKRKTADCTNTQKCNDSKSKPESESTKKKKAPSDQKPE